MDWKGTSIKAAFWLAGALACGDAAGGDVAAPRIDLGTRAFVGDGGIFNSPTVMPGCNGNDCSPSRNVYGPRLASPNGAGDAQPRFDYRQPPPFVDRAVPAMTPPDRRRTMPGGRRVPRFFDADPGCCRDDR